MTEYSKTLSDILNGIKDINQVFALYCKNGNIISAKKLYEFSLTNEKYKIDIHYDDDEAFMWGCWKGDMEIIQFVYDISQNENSPINMHLQYEYAFRWNCDNNRLDIVKWLYEICLKNNSPVDIHINNETIFIKSCINGNLDMVKWLYHISIEEHNIINIHANNDEAFIESCKNKKYDLARWLCTLTDEYEIKINPYSANNKDEIFYKITNIKTELADALKMYNFDKINEIYDRFSYIENCNEDTISERYAKHECPICYDENMIYFIKLGCTHIVCLYCFIKMNKCYYNCIIDINNILFIKNIYI